MHKKTLTVLLSLMSMATAQNVTLIGFLPTSFNSIVPPVVDEDRNLVYYTEGKFLNIYDFKQEKTFQKLDMSSLIRALALSPDHKTLWVSKSGDPILLALNTTTWQPSTKFTDYDYRSDTMQMTPNGETLLAKYGSSMIQAISLPNGKIINLSVPSPVAAFALSPNGEILAVSFRGKLQTFAPDGATVLNTFNITADDPVYVSLAISPDGKKLAGGTNDGEIVVWDLLTRAEVQRIKARLTNLNHLTFSPNNRYLVASTQYIVDQVNIFDLMDGRRVNVPSDKHEFEWAATFTSDGKNLFVSTDRGVRIYDTSQLNPLNAQVLLNVDPLDAKVLLGGKKPQLDPDGVTKIFSGVPVEVEVTKPFYKTFTTTLKLKGGEIKNLNIVLERESGSLTLTSTPRGATVLIDGQEKGKTPLKLSRFDAGEYTVTLKLNDHKEFTQRMILQGGQDAVLNATLVTQPSIKLTSRPTGAQVWMGDQLVCEKTPCTLRNLKPSIQEFTFRLNGFPDLKAKAVIPEEGTTNLDVTLKK